MAGESRADVRLRRASAGDAPLLSDVAASLFDQTFGEANTPDDMAMYLEKTFRPELQAAELGDPSTVVWIAEDALGTAIGYAMLRRDSHIECVQAEGPAEVQRIYADRSVHGRGVGEALMRRCVEQSLAWSCDVLWLAVWQKNPRAIAFYEKHDFRRAGVTTFQLGNDRQHDYVMARALIKEP